MTKRESAMIDEAIELLKRDEWMAGIRLIRQSQGKRSEYDLSREELGDLKFTTDLSQFKKNQEFKAQATSRGKRSDVIT